MPSNNFDDFLDEIEAEAKAEGPEAVRDLEAKRLKYRLARARDVLATGDVAVTAHLLDVSADAVATVSGQPSSST